MEFGELLKGNCPICLKKREDINKELSPWLHIMGCYEKILGYSPFEGFEISSKIFFINMRNRKVVLP